MSFMDFAALLNGMATEASAVRQERAKQENDNFLQTHTILSNLLTQPGLRDQDKELAQQAILDLTMEHMGYNKKSKQTNPIRKAVEGMVGQNAPNYAGKIAQTGVGSGNAKTSVGGAPGLAQGGPPAPPPQAGPAEPQDWSAGALPPPPPPQVAMPATAQPQGRFYTQEEQEAQKAAATQKELEMKLTAAQKELEMKEKISLDMEDQAFDRSIARVTNSELFKELATKDPTMADNIKAVLLAGKTGVIPEGSRNYKTAPANMAMPIDIAIAQYPEHAAELQEMKANGIPFVLERTNPRKTGKEAVVGFAPFNATDIYSSPGDVERNIALAAYAQSIGTDPKNLTPAQQQAAIVRQADLKANLVPVWDPKAEVVTYRRKSAAEGQAAPRTTFDMAGVPSTGGTAGVSLSPPPAVPGETQSTLASYDYGLKQISPILTQIRDYKARLDKNPFGPLAGRVTLAELEHIGGAGADPEAVKLAVDLRRFLMSQAFADGGKQLTDTEKSEFIRTLPALSDTLTTAITKAEGAETWLGNRKAARLSNTPIRQSSQLPSNNPAAVNPTAPNKEATHVFNPVTGKIEVKKK